MSRDALIGRWPCGCITYANARPDDLDREDARELALIIRKGGEVLRTTVDEAKVMPHFLVLECPHDPKGWERQQPPSRLHKTYHDATVGQRGKVTAWYVSVGLERIGLVVGSRGAWRISENTTFDAALSDQTYRTRDEAVTALREQVDG